MKREELKAKIEAIERWDWIETNTEIMIESVCRVSKTQVNNIHFTDMNYDAKWALDLIKDILDYAMTPINEREDSKKFYLQMVELAKDVSYLNKGHGAEAVIKGYFFGTFWTSECKQTKFTLEEITQMPESFQNLTWIETK